jgi:hypothetical protein
MQLLSADQIRQAVEVMRGYLAAPKNPDGRTLIEVQTERDQFRVKLIETELKPLLKDYLSSRISLNDFKTKIDGINKRNEFWGFKGVKGQMFFNMVVNVSEDLTECDREIKAAIAAPVSEEMASSQIKALTNYVRRIGERHLESGGTKQGRPNVGSVPFFLSYFWQIHDRDVWPVFYTNSVNVMTDMNLWLPTGEATADYLTYKRIHEELGRVFSEDSKRHFDLYEVEHVFWFKGGNPYGGTKPLVRDEVLVEAPENKAIVNVPETVIRLPESYVPPIVAILPRMARNEASLREAAKASGTSLERAFEKNINAAFTILNYETKLLGQGQGRVPDGQALSVDDSYAILWDAKVRTDGYSMGTDDRAVREYITTQSRELKRRRSLRNIYYFIVSSHFADDSDDAIRSLKMETDVNEVCLVEADALVAIVEAKMRSPREVSLGPDGLQRLFSVSGVLSADIVRENLV